MAAAFINMVELLAAEGAIQKWTQSQDQVLTVFTDNSMTGAYFNGGARPEILYRTTQGFLTGCRWLNGFTPRGTDSSMTTAPPRGTSDTDERSLSRICSDHASVVFGRPWVNLFTSGLTAKSSTLCSRWLSRSTRWLEQ